MEEGADASSPLFDAVFESEEEFVEMLRDRIGDTLLVCAVYDAEDHRFLHRNEARIASIPASDYERVRDELVFEDLSTGYYDHLTAAGGRLEASIRVFEQFTLFNFPIRAEGQVGGLALAVAGTADVPIPEVVRI